MIRLTHPSITKELTWTENQHVCELVIEAPTFFRQVTQEINFPLEDGTGLNFVDADKGDSLKMSSQVDVIYNPQKLDFNNRRAVATLWKLLVKSSNSEDFYLSTNRLKTKIVKYLGDVVDSENFGFEIVADDFTLDQIAKAVNFHIASDDEDFVEILTDYLEVMVELAKIKIFVFINLRSYMTTSDYERFIKNIINHQFDVLLIENQNRTSPDVVQKIIIDQDLCEI